MKKRILSALLALVMVFTLIPMSVFAETGSESEPVTKVGDEYRISYSVYSDRMCDAVSIQILDANGNAVSPEDGMSIRSYSMKLLESSEFSDYLRRMIIMMLDYGSLVQIYSGKAVEKIANYFVTEEHRAVFDGYEYPTG